VTLSLHRRSTPVGPLSALGLLCALAACAPAADHLIVHENPRQNTPIPGPFQSPAGTAPKRVVVIGDSLSTGYGTSPEEAWPLQLGQEVQPGQQSLEIMNAAADGAGYIAAGEAGETFGSQIAATVNASTDVVVFFGSDNDAGQDPADLKAAVTDALSNSKTLAPTRPASSSAPSLPSIRPGRTSTSSVTWRAQLPSTTAWNSLIRSRSSGYPGPIPHCWAQTANTLAAKDSNSSKRGSKAYSRPGKARAPCRPLLKPRPAETKPRAAPPGRGDPPRLLKLWLIL
jgi:hypothetical protein